MNSQQIRLNKFLAERLGISRREADELIQAGKVTVDGKSATVGMRVTRTDSGSGRGPQNVLQSKNFKEKKEPTGSVQNSIIRCNGHIVPYEAKYIYLAFNKPVGYVCSRRAQGSAPTLYDLLPEKYRKLKTVGRLDKDSSGLILLTNDGDFAYQMTHPKFRKQKIYEVELDKPLTPLHQQMISDYGVLLDDGVSRFMVVKDDSAESLLRGIRSCDEDEMTSPVKTGARNVPKKTVQQNRYITTLTEGRNRQIRRTFAALGYQVVKLHRTEFGKYQLSGLKPGHFQFISP